MPYQRISASQALERMVTYQPPSDHPIMKFNSEEYRQQYRQRRAFTPDWMGEDAALQTRIMPAALRAALKPIIRSHNRNSPLPNIGDRATRIRPGRTAYQLHRPVNGDHQDRAGGVRRCSAGRL